MRELGNPDSEVSKDLKQPGVYIWGFLYEKESNSEKTKSKLCNDHCDKKHDWKILKCKDTEIDKVYEAIQSVKQEPCSDYLFIPYYVGMSLANSSKSFPLKRLIQHSDIIKGNSLKIDPDNKSLLKYLRLKEEYMLCFHKHTFNQRIPVFPIMKGLKNYNNVWLALSNYLEYFNHRLTCSAINENLPLQNLPGDYPIDVFTREVNDSSGAQIVDPIEERLKLNVNFWFTYCDLDSLKKDKNQLHQAEAATYFALRGITFSRTHTVEFPKGWNIENNSGFDIFLNNASQKTLGKNNPRTCDLKDEFNWPGYW
jgi:hypothetical protein